MSMAAILLLSPVLLGQAPAPKADAPDAQMSKAKRERLLEIYRGEAARYTIYRDSSHRDKAELQREPVYLWTNPLRSGGQDGAVFVWTCRGRAEVLASFFSDPAVGPRKLNHELHSLSTSVLDVSRPGPHSWTPEGPGIDLKPIPDAPTPGATPRARLIQVRALTRDFTGNNIDRDQKRWELRPLAHPLYRYESTDPDILDGAVIAFVSSSGTDPEAILVLEARRPTPKADPVWHYGLARFTDLDLAVRYKGKEVFTATSIPWNGPRQDAKHRYRAFNDRVIPAVEDEAR